MSLSFWGYRALVDYSREKGRAAKEEYVLNLGLETS
jgi:hypothetical protein